MASGTKIAKPCPSQCFSVRKGSLRMSTSILTIKNSMASMLQECSILFQVEGTPCWISVKFTHPNCTTTSTCFYPGVKKWPGHWGSQKGSRSKTIWFHFTAASLLLHLGVLSPTRRHPGPPHLCATRECHGFLGFSSHTGGKHKEASNGAELEQSLTLTHVPR